MDKTEVENEKDKMMLKTVDVTGNKDKVKFALTEKKMPQSYYNADYFFRCVASISM